MDNYLQPYQDPKRPIRGAALSSKQKTQCLSFGANTPSTQILHQQSKPTLRGFAPVSLVAMDVDAKPKGEAPVTKAAAKAKKPRAKKPAEPKKVTAAAKKKPSAPKRAFAALNNERIEMGLTGFVCGFLCVARPANKGKQEVKSADEKPGAEVKAAERDAAASSAAAAAPVAATPSEVEMELRQAFLQQM